MQRSYQEHALNGGSVYLGACACTIRCFCKYSTTVLEGTLRADVHMTSGFPYVSITCVVMS